MSGKDLRILLASRNPGKAAEVRRILDDLNVEILTLEDLPGSPEVEEDGATFKENALKKARAIARWYGGMALADDSGLEVDALDGAPGVRSARYAGEETTDLDNNQKLLQALEGVPPDARTARFRCALALVDPGGEEWVVEDTCEGVIVGEIRGTLGFGYDPLFLFPEIGLTFGEMTPEVKNRVSHRAKALEKLRKILETIAP